MEYSCCFTGYRPAKFPFNLEKSGKELTTFDNALFDAVVELVNEGVTVFYTGMAMGFDIIAAETVLTVGKIRNDVNISLVAAVPFIEQPSGFSPCWKERYNRVLEQADKVILLSDKYYKGCFTKRNKFMVDSCDFVLTYHTGLRGGTYNTIKYAEGLGRKIINIAR